MRNGSNGMRREEGNEATVGEAKPRDKPGIVRY